MCSATQLFLWNFTKAEKNLIYTKADFIKLNVLINLIDTNCTFLKWCIYRKKNILEKKNLNIKNNDSKYYKQKYILFILFMAFKNVNF